MEGHISIGTKHNAERQFWAGSTKKDGRGGELVSQKCCGEGGGDMPLRLTSSKGMVIGSVFSTNNKINVKAFFQMHRVA